MLPRSFREFLLKTASKRTTTKSSSFQDGQTRGPAWFGFLLLGVAILFGLYRLQLDVEVLNLLPAQEPVVAGLKLYQRHFSNARELIVTIKAVEAERAELAAGALAGTLKTFTNLVSAVTWRPGWMEKPGEAAELIGYLWLNQPPSLFADLAMRLTGTNRLGLLQDAREQLATSLSPGDLARRGYDPFNLLQLPENVTGGQAANFGEGENLFASSDGAFRILFVRATPSLRNYRDCRRWLDHVKRIAEGMRERGELDPDVVLGYTGAPAFVSEIAGGMEFDTTVSVGLTSVIIAVLFWLAHRRWRPVLWLLTLLALVLASTLALGGLVFGAVNVVSLGFAAILLGLAVDYAVVHYQEAIASPNATIPEIRRAIGPSIFWAAATTICAFLVLNLGGLPGLAQLGSLVALGVGLSALVMIYAFLPPLFPHRRAKRVDQLGAREATRGSSPAWNPMPILGRTRRQVPGTTAVIVVVGTVVLTGGLPAMDHTADALRPRHSAAHAAVEEIKTRLAQGRDPLWLITQGADESELGRRLDQAALILSNAVSSRLLSGFTLPTTLWPRRDYQNANRTTAARLVSQQPELTSAALSHGFSTNSLAMTEAIFRTWRASLRHTDVFWPTNETSRWILEKIIARTGGGFLIVGFAYPTTHGLGARGSLDPLAQQLKDAGFILSGWELLGPAILDRVQQRLWWMLTPMITLVGLSLWLAFARVSEIALSVAVLGLSGLCLLTTMKLCGWSWNLLNLMALPLMLGTGVDYSIFTLLALRRHHGNLDAAYRSVGRALLLCGATAMTGFGSLALSSNAGMASLGLLCAIAIGFNMLISVFLLPVWWRAAMTKPHVG